MKKIKTLLGLFLVAGSFSSCEMDFLPTNNMEQSQSFRSVNDLEKHMNGLYQSLRASYSGDALFLPDIYTDLFHPTVTYGNNYGPMYNVTGSSSSDEEYSTPWSEYYSFVTNVNNLLNNAPGVTKTDADTAEYNKVMGEAHWMRAFIYSYLVKHFSKSYDASTASTDLGLPLVTSVNPLARPARSTIQQTYDLILSDLAQVENYWNNATFPASITSYKGSSAELTPVALDALKARVYLEMDNYAGALSAAEAVINTGRYPLITDSATFATMWHEDRGSEIIFHGFISSDEKPNTLSNYLGSYTATTGQYSPLYIPQQWVIDVYDNTDIRKGVYFAQPPLLLGRNFTGVYVLNKYPRTTEFTSSGGYEHSPIYFRVSEMYLIAAEAAVQSGETAKALTYLNALRNARGLSSLTAVALSDVQAERLREMLGEGNRLSDLKRWGMGITRGVPQNVDAVAPNSLYLSIEASHNRMVWPIPNYDMSTNASLVQNPGW